LLAPNQHTRLKIRYDLLFNHNTSVTDDRHPTHRAMRGRLIQHSCSASQNEYSPSRSSKI